MAPPAFPTAFAVRRCQRVAPAPEARSFRVAENARLKRTCGPQPGQGTPNGVCHALHALLWSVSQRRRAARSRRAALFRWTLHRPGRAKTASLLGQAAPSIPERDAGSLAFALGPNQLGLVAVRLASAERSGHPRLPERHPGGDAANLPPFRGTRCGTSPDSSTCCRCCHIPRRNCCLHEPVTFRCAARVPT